MKDYYKILQLHFGASSVDIKSAYRKLAFQYHPDKNNNDSNSEEKFKEITEAYYVLSDENRRIVYHAEYNDFLNNKYINRIPNYTTPQQQYSKPTDIPKQPRGPAADYSDNYNGVRMLVLSFFVFMLIFLLIKTRQEIQERKEKEQLYVQQVQMQNEKNADTLTTDELYKIIYQEFLESGDSTLMNSNIDSLKQVFDSLQRISR